MVIAIELYKPWPLLTALPLFHTTHPSVHGPLFLAFKHKGSPTFDPFNLCYLAHSLLDTLMNLTTYSFLYLFIKRTRGLGGVSRPGLRA